MLTRALLRRELGRDPPQAVQRAEHIRRTFSINLSQTKEIKAQHDNGIHALDLDISTGRYLICGSQDKAISIYDTLVRSKNLGSRYRCPSVHKIKQAHAFSVETVQWYPHDNGLFTSSGMDGCVKLWDARTMQEALCFSDFTGGVVYNHAMSSIGSHGLIAVGSTSRKVTLCDPSTGLAAHQLSGHQKNVLAVAWSPKNEYLLASASADNQILCWDIRSSGPLLTLDQYNGEARGTFSNHINAHDGAVNGLQYTHDGEHLLSTGNDGRLRVWDANTGQNTLLNIAGFNNKSSKNITFCVSRGSRDRLIFHPHNSDIAVYNLSTGVLRNMLKGHYREVHSCIFHPTREEVYSGSSDAEVLVWTPQIDNNKLDVDEANTDMHDDWS
eukprot:m.50431 g.50431  ORF g.50431 m.50431 type:complete len:384 (-) comp21297_c1_seq1:52-1203(-)